MYKRGRGGNNGLGSTSTCRGSYGSYAKYPTVAEAFQQPQQYPVVQYQYATHQPQQQATQQQYEYVAATPATKTSRTRQSPSNSLQQQYEQKLNELHEQHQQQANQLHAAFYAYQQQQNSQQQAAYQDQYDHQTQEQLLRQLDELPVPHGAASSMAAALGQATRHQPQQYVTNPYGQQRGGQQYFTTGQYANLLQQQQDQILKSQQQYVQQQYYNDSRKGPQFASPSTVAMLESDVNANTTAATEKMLGVHYSPSSGVSHTKFSSNGLNYNY